MTQKIEINIPNKLNKELELITVEEGYMKNEIVKKAIDDYLYIRKFRARLIKKAKAQGYESDEDILYHESCIS